MVDLIRSIDSSGSGDYTTWQLWEDDCSADLVTDGDNWIGEQVNEEQTSTSTLTISGITTDASNRLIMRAASGASFVDNATPGTDPLRYDTTKGAAYRKTTSYGSVVSISSVRVEVEQLQFRADGNTVAFDALNHTQPYSLKQCIVDSRSTIAVVRAVRLSGNNTLYQNTVIIADNTGPCAIVRTADFEYCTLYVTGTADCVTGNYGTGDFTNCLFLGGSTFQGGTNNHSVDYCVTDLASWESSTATNSVLNATAADEIENDTGVKTTCDLSAKSGGDSDGGGTPLTVTVDIYGQTRDGTSPTVGAFEIVSARAGLSIPVAMYHRQQFNRG